MTKTKRVHLNLTREQLTSLAMLSARHGAPIAELVRRAVTAYLEIDKVTDAVRLRMEPGRPREGKDR